MQRWLVLFHGGAAEVELDAERGRGDHTLCAAGAKAKVEHLLLPEAQDSHLDTSLV